eukprot:195567_1
MATTTETEETKIQSEELPLQIITQPEQSAPPKSLVAQQKDHTKRDKIISKCFNLTYDTLTIFISIADVTTDIMVLISYYLDNRMTFFWISFIILLVAQIG